MKIRRSAFHYRVYTLLVSLWTEGPMIFSGSRTSHRPKNLCRYFWTITLLLLTVPVWSAIALVAGTIFGIMYGAYLVWDALFSDHWRGWRIKRRRKRAERVARWNAQRMEKEETPPGLLVSFLRAKKARACPLIEIID